MNARRELALARNGIYHEARLAKTAMWKDLFTSDDGSIRPWVTYGATGLVILAVACFGYAAWTRSGESQKVTWMCMTEGCGYKTARSMKFKEPLPAKCPKCDKNSLVPAFKCKKCGEPLILNQDRGLEPPTICPNCGESRYGP